MKTFMQHVLEEFNAHLDEKSQSIRWPFLNAASYRLNKFGIITKKQPVEMQIARLKRLKEKFLTHHNNDLSSIYDLDLKNPENAILFDIENIIKNIDYREYYKNLIKKTMRETISFLISNHWEDIKNYKSYHPKAKEIFLKISHEKAIEIFKNNFSNHPYIYDYIQPFKVKDLIDSINKKDEVEKKDYMYNYLQDNFVGSASNNGNILYVQGKDTVAGGALSIILHETSHAIEISLSYIYSKNRNMIPLELKEDVKLNYMHMLSNSYLSIQPFEHIYKEQYMERLAYEISQLVENSIKKELDERNIDSSERTEIINNCKSERSIKNIQHLLMGKEIENSPRQP